MAENEQLPQRKTNAWDFAINLTNKLIDKGRLGSLIVIVMFGIFIFALFKRLDSVDAREVSLQFLEYAFHWAIVLLIAANLVQVWGFAALSKQQKREINRLVKYKRAFFHYKKLYFDFIKEGLEKGTVRKFEDLKDFDIEDLVDIKHHPSGYSLGGDSGGTS